MSDLATIGFKAETSGLTKAQTELNKTAVAGGKVDSQLSTLKKTIGSLAASFAVLGLVSKTKDLIAYSDAWKNINSQLRQVTSSEKELIATREKLLALSSDTRSNLVNTIDLYSQITRSTKDLNISSTDLMSITKTLNNLFVSGGKPISEVNGAIRQLNQGFAAGALRGDEFNSVAEGAPKIMDALSVALSMSRGELREFAATGGITAEIMISALSSYSDEAQRMADQTTKTFGQSMENSTTNITAFVGEMSSLNNMIDSLGSGIEGFTEDLDHLTNAGLAAATVYGGAIVVSLTKSTAATVTDIIAKNALAAAEVNRLKVLMAAAAADAAATTARVQRIPGYYLEASTLALITEAELAKTAATTAYTTAANRATISTTALSTATKFLLGPWGLLITAVGVAAVAFSTSKDNAGSLNKSLDEQATIVNKLAGEYEKYSKQRLGTTAVQAQMRLAEIDQRRLDIAKEMTQAAKDNAASGMGGMVSGEQLVLIKETKELNEEYGKLEVVLAAVDKVFQDGIPPLTKRKMKTTSLTDSTVSYMDAATKMATQLGMQNAELRMSANEYELMTIKMQLLAEGVAPELITALLSVAKANQDLTDSMAGDDELDSIISKVDELGGAWTRTGSTIVDAFGSAVDVMADYQAQMKGITDLQSKLNDKRAEYVEEGKDTAKIDVALAKVNEESIAAQISGYGDLAGAASSMFSEKTVAARAFSAVEAGIAALQIAASLQKIVMSSAEAAAVVASETVKQGALATTAVLNQGTGDPYTAFVRMAAMAAIVGSLVSSSGSSSYSDSSSSTQSTQGTGSVLGDSEAQSESIANGVDILADISIDQLSELQSISLAMASVSAGIESVATTASTYGDVSSITYRSDDEVSLKSDAGTFTTSEGNSLYSAVTGVFDDARLVIEESASALGIDVATAVSDYTISAFSVDIEDMSADEAEEAISSVFSSVIDTMSSSLLPSLVQFQDTGEGTFETLVRLAEEQSVFNDFLSAMETDLSDLSSVMQIDVTQSIIDLIGSFEDLEDLTADLISGFFTESEQLAILEESLTDVFDSVGLSLIDNKEEFIELMQGIDLTTEAGQELYATLLEINPSLSEYIDALDDLSDDKLSLQIELLEAQGYAEEALLLSRQAELDAMDESLHALQLQVWAEEDRADAIEETTDALEDSITEMESLIETINGVTSTDTTDDLSAALLSAISGDFDLALDLDYSSLSDLDSDDFATSSEQIIAQAINDAMISNISDLAQLEIDDAESEISLLETQNDILVEINESIINQALIGGESNYTTQTASVAESSEQIAATQEEVKYMTESMTKNIAEMQSALNQIKNGGLSVYTTGDDTVATTSV